MKIGFFGNTNNYPFMLARGMRMMGHDVLFLVDRSEPLHRPECRYKNISLPYPDWIKQVDELKAKDYVLSTRGTKRVIELLKSCDAVVLNWWGPCLLPLIGRPGIALLTGADLQYCANWETIQRMALEKTWKPLFIRQYLYKKLIPAQRAGIKSAVAVSYFTKGLIPDGDQLLEEIGVQDRQRMFFQMTDVDLIEPQPLPHNQPLRVFCATRFTWKKPSLGCSELDYKGSDIMIRGLARFCQTTGTRLNIRFVKKGLHVAESMRLVEEEGLANQVTWLDEMTQKELYKEIEEADIIFEHFGKGVIGMAGLDAMAMGRPVIGNGRPDIFDEEFGVPTAVCQATTVEEIVKQLERLVADPAERERAAQRARDYVCKFFSPERAAKICLERLAPHVR